MPSKAMSWRAAAQERLDGIRKWLNDEAPYIIADQRHLDEGSPERAYWHYGYQAALADVLKYGRRLKRGDSKGNTGG